MDLLVAFVVFVFVFFAWFASGMEVDYIKNKQWLDHLKNDNYYTHKK